MLRLYSSKTSWPKQPELIMVSAVSRFPGHAVTKNFVSPPG